MLLPVKVPNRPNINVMHIAVALKCVGKTATTDEFITDIETPANIKCMLSRMIIRVWFVSHVSAKPTAADPPKSDTVKKNYFK